MTETTNASAPVDAPRPPTASGTEGPLAATAATPPAAAAATPPAAAAATPPATRPATTAARLLVSGQLLGDWTLDPTQSSAEFAGKHLWGAMTVRGRFDDLSGQGVVAEDHTVNGRLEIATASVDTGNARRDKHLRSTRFLSTELHPRIVLTAVNVTVEAQDRLVVRGSLAARGAARPVTFAVDILETTPDHITLEANLVVDRTDFGITWSPMRMASNRVLGHVVAHFVRTP